MEQKITIITMYRGRDAETFVHAVIGRMTAKEKRAWRKEHECDSFYKGDEDDRNSMFFCETTVTQAGRPCVMHNADGSIR